MNASTCAQLWESVDWRSPRLIVVFAVLGFINVMVVVGNVLVIAAVHQSSKLRSVTNLFIVSLAVADLLVGLAVLPFSSTLEVSKVWIFGDLWCSAWLAVDVWMCTASILNLCAISLDRYVAVTRPVTYPSIMSARRARWLIAAVWVLSFVICFPPLVGWKDTRMTDFNSDLSSPTRGRIGALPPSLLGGQRPRLPSETAPPPIEAATTPVTSTTIAALTAAAFAAIARNDSDFYTTDLFDSSPPTELPTHCPWVCELTNDTGYVIYSALGSFFIPMFVMLFFYWRIYRAAVSTTRAINQGFRTTKGSRRAFGARFDEQRLTLRIHRGRGSVLHGSPSSATSGASAVSALSATSATSATTTTPLSVSPGGRSSDSHKFQRSSARRRECNRTPDKIKISVSYPSSDAICQQDKNGGGTAAAAAAAAAAAVAAAAERCANPGNGSGPNAPGSLSPSTSKKSSFSSASSPTGPGPGTMSGGPGPASLLGNGSARKASTASLSPGSPVSSLATSVHRDACHLRVSVNRLSAFRRRRSSADSDCGAHAQALGVDLSASSRDLSTSPTADDPVGGAGGGVAVGGPNRARLISKMGKRNIKAQVKRFRMETKAAKTLAIIVGGFVVCWLPFFTMYLVRAFCPLCIHPTVFSVLFWLGYCNSAINPCIYALFSKDFRFAFKRVICRFLCAGSSANAGCGGNSGGGGGGACGGVTTATTGGGVRRSSQRSARRGSEGSQLGLRVLGGTDGRVKTASVIDIGSDSR